MYLISAILLFQILVNILFSKSVSFQKFKILALVFFVGIIIAFPVIQLIQLFMQLLEAAPDASAISLNPDVLYFWLAAVLLSIGIQAIFNWVIFPRMNKPKSVRQDPF